MSNPIEDPVSRVRMSFERRGENLLVDLWLMPGGSLPSHLHPRQEERWSVVAGSARFAVPALRLQPFLEESAAAAREGLFTSRGLPRGLRGARWAARFLKKYRDETVFLSPPRPLQSLLIALLARD